MTFTVEGLCHAYGRRSILAQAQLRVESGEWVGIVGANGSGKSTLLKALTGILRPASGSIRMKEGVSVGYLPQQSEIQRDFPASVWEVALSGCLGRMKKRFRPGFGYDAPSRAQAEKALELLGMADFKKRPYNELSGGQQQRVLLARALCASDSLLLLDEPITGLDPDAARDMYAIIRRLNDQGTSILMVTHDMEAALEESSHILCLCQRHSTSAADGTKEEKSNFFGPTEAYRASLAQDGCSCCGMEHKKNKPELQIPSFGSVHFPAPVNKPLSNTENPEKEDLHHDA